jgi:hypothetical protein
VGNRVWFAWINGIGVGACLVAGVVLGRWDLLGFTLVATGLLIWAEAACHA